MLLDPFEEQFGLPVLLVKHRDHLRLECEIVGQESDAFSGFVLAQIEHRQTAGLVAHVVFRGSIDRMQISPLEFDIALGSRDKERIHHMKFVGSSEVQISTIHQATRTGFDHQIVKNTNLVDLAVGDVNKGRDRAAQIEQRVQFDNCLSGSK